MTFINSLHETLKKNGFDPIEWEIRSLPIVNSTNDFVNKMFKLNVDQCIVLSVIQEKGKGRGDHTWESPEGGMWLSIGIKYSSRIFELSTPIVQVVQKVIAKYMTCEVKPPNDIMVHDKKISGVLVETKMSKSLMSEIIIGVGINVENELPEELETIATTMKNHINPPSVINLAVEISVNIIQKLQELEILKN